MELLRTTRLPRSKAANQTASSQVVFAEARRIFHASLLETTLTRNKYGVVSNADGKNKLSRQIAEGIALLLKSEIVSERLPAQTAGCQFEDFCAQFLRDTFLQLGHLRPGDWTVKKIGGATSVRIAEFEQYKHLRALAKRARDDPILAAALGNDYSISPDVVVARAAVSVAEINRTKVLIDDSVSKLSGLRERAEAMPMLHASISCKWTLRSDRAQNARSEALNLIRNRKGRLPHIAVVTAEPLPSRIASLALGTGDIDCVYHFALPELIATVHGLGTAKAIQQLEVMVAGERLKDISDLPLDLAL